jgi:hypothetical protein
VSPAGLDDHVPLLSVKPAAVTTVPGGDYAKVKVKLTAFFADATAASTVVRVIGQDGAEVACDASGFAHECALTGWTFSFDGVRYSATKTIQVQTLSGTPLGSGQVQLRIDETATEIVFPATATTQGGALEGVYRGRAISDGMPGGFAVTVIVRGSHVIVRDPARIVAPDGALVLDLTTDDPGAVAERTVTWLRAPGAPDTAGAIVGETVAGVSTPGPEQGRLQIPFSIRFDAGVVDAWNLELFRQGDVEPECTAAAECESGEVCPASVGVCVPSSAWAPPPTPIGNQLDDLRSQAWWDAIDDLLGTGEVVSGLSKPAFATTGPDLIETILCTVSETEAAAGRLGITQVKNGSSAPSLSGDLACVNGSGVQNQAPGAVGLITRADRKGQASSSALLTMCLQDLARQVTGDFSLNFNVNTGDCVNLARFVPALRLLATGELGKRTRADGDGRGRGLFTRLVQQWTQLQGFLASTGLSEREYDDAAAATPAEGRSELLALLDVLDANWAALLDRRVARLFPAASTWAPTSSTDAARDYRLLKRPTAYWPLNASLVPNLDIIQGTPLVIPFRPCDLTGTCPIPDWCKILPSRDSFLQAWNCRGYIANLPQPVLGDDDVSVVFNADPLDEEFTPYAGGTIVASQKLAVVYAYPNGTPTILVMHPTLDPSSPDVKEMITFDGFGSLGHWTGGTTGGDGPPAGTSVALVRDSASKTYTLYLWRTDTAPDFRAITRPYTYAVGGGLSSISVNRLLVGAGPMVTGSHWWQQYNKSFAARIDDVAVFNSILSKREFLRFAQARNYTENQRYLWPASMNLVDHDTQELAVPVGAALLEAQAAHLDVAARLVDHMKYQAQAACEGDGLAADAAQADLELIFARIGRTLRQSAIIEHFADADLSERAEDARQLVRAKRSQIGRRLETLVGCENPYGMAEGEVPLYFGSIAPNIDEKAAFFAASDHLLQLAEQRAATAQGALIAVQSAWNNARLSQIQEQQDANSRAIRVDEMKSKYGEGLRRLCGISDMTADQVMQEVNAGTFDVDTCFVTPNATCLSQSATGPIMDADPTCYRGVLGAAIMDMRTSYHAQQAAYQNWQAAAGNAESAERLCVLLEMDTFGCEALDRHELEGVTCPPGHEGTLDLIDAFNDYMDEKETEKGWFDTLISTATTIGATVAAYATTGPGGAFFTATLGVLSPLSNEMSRSMEARKRRHEEMLAQRSAVQEIRECWTQAEQYERAIAAAEESSLEATARMQSAGIAFQNGLAEAREILLEGPIVIDRELTRPSIPIAFHYWLPEAITDYRRALDSARRYAYVALRAVEYDTFDSYVAAQAGKPLRSAVLGAWRPNAILDQLTLMRDQTATRTTLYGPPKLGHITFDLGAKFFGIEESSIDFGPTLVSYSRPVYSTRGEYLGLGVRFSLVPATDDEAPTWRCAERIWRVNVGTAGYPSGGGDNFHLKLLKRNLFASRRCRDEGFQSSTLRPGTNLLVGAGEPQTYTPEPVNSVADISVVRLDTGNALDDFRHRDDAYNASSTELSLQGLYGDYVLLFPNIALESGLDLTGLFDFNLRFDFVSIDDTPPTFLSGGGRAGPRVQIDASREPIVVQ